LGGPGFGSWSGCPLPWPRFFPCSQFLQESVGVIDCNRLRPRHTKIFSSRLLMILSFLMCSYITFTFDTVSWNNRRRFYFMLKLRMRTALLPRHPYAFMMCLKRREFHVYWAGIRIRATAVGVGVGTLALVAAASEARPLRSSPQGVNRWCRESCSSAEDVPRSHIRGKETKNSRPGSSTALLCIVVDHFAGIVWISHNESMDVFLFLPCQHLATATASFNLKERYDSEVIGGIFVGMVHTK
jgi:hypothetical protein